jgi:hypothetical protein
MDSAPGGSQQKVLYIGLYIRPIAFIQAFLYSEPRFLIDRCIRPSAGFHQERSGPYEKMAASQGGKPAKLSFH